MFGFTRKTDYALVALARLAQEGRDGSPLSARQIADQFGLPLALLMNLLKDLHRAGLVQSRRGAAGGYLLADEPGRISLADVVEAIEGPLGLTPCADRLGRCRRLGCCPISGSIRRFSSQVAALLGGVTLEDLAGGPGEAALSRLAKMEN